MALRISKPPTELVVTLEEARDHLLIDADDTSQDRAIQREILAVTAWLAGPSGWLGRSLIEQELELTVAGDQIGERAPIALPRPPALGVDEVAWVDRAGQAHVVPPAAYHLVLGDDGLSHLSLGSDGALPALGGDRAYIRIRYRGGYGKAAADVDEGLRQAILMTLARVHEFRGDGVTGALQADPFIRDLFAPYRVF